MGTGALGIGPNVDTLANITAVSNKLSFVSDPRVSCLLPASMKLWQANLLVYRKVKNLKRTAILERKMGC